MRGDGGELREGLQVLVDELRAGGQRRVVGCGPAGGVEQAAGLGDPIRLQLMSMIASAPGGEICVCDLTPAFTISSTTISHHLKVLREAGPVDAERRASWVYYRPRPALMRQLSVLLAVDQPVTT